jgi:hypothetical protein
MQASFSNDHQLAGHLVGLPRPLQLPHSPCWISLHTEHPSAIQSGMTSQLCISIRAQMRIGKRVTCVIQLMLRELAGALVMWQSICHHSNMCLATSFLGQATTAFVTVTNSQPLLLALHPWHDATAPRFLSVLCQLGPPPPL